MASAPLDSRGTIALICAELERCKIEFAKEEFTSFSKRDEITERLFQLAKTEFESQLSLDTLVKGKLRGNAEWKNLQRIKEIEAVKKIADAIFDRLSSPAPANGASAPAAPAAAAPAAPAAPAPAAPAALELPVLLPMATGAAAGSVTINPAESDCVESIVTGTLRVAPDNAIMLITSLAKLIFNLQKENQKLTACLVEERSAVQKLTSAVGQLSREAGDRMKCHEQSIESIRTDISSLQRNVHWETVEFTVNRWSEVKESAVFGTGTPLRAWGHEFWLKVEKSPDRVGLYLCCGEEGRFPFSVDYQLAVRRRSGDDFYCASVVFRTEFGREKAWGLSKFSTLEAIEREGGYVRSEDSITFIARLIAVKGCKETGKVIRPPGAASL